MLAELVFVTRFLGLVAGERELVLHADAEVRRVEILREGRTLAVLDSEPWRVKTDLGRDLGPYVLTARGYDAAGREIARDEQIVNLARPAAEAGVLLERMGDGTMLARLQWTHVDGKDPVSAVMKLDGKVVSRSTRAEGVSLGRVDARTIHSIGAELQFADGVSARKEIVFGGIYSDEVPAELTPIAVHERPKAEARGPCLRVGGRDVIPTGLENGTALVSFVVNGGAPLALQDLDGHRDRLYVLGNADLIVVSPVLREGPGPENFQSEEVRGGRSTRSALVMDHRERGRKRFGDAIAASAFRALRANRRRAIVYVLGSNASPDDSEHAPDVVRLYLARTGVPLRVWSLTGPRPDLERAWGKVMDVSTPRALLQATQELRDELALQRIAWVPGDPLEAIRATATPECRYQPLAKGD